MTLSKFKNNFIIWVSGRLTSFEDTESITEVLAKNGYTFAVIYSGASKQRYQVIRAFQPDDVFMGRAMEHPKFNYYYQIHNCKLIAFWDRGEQIHV